MEPVKGAGTALPCQKNHQPAGTLDAAHAVAREPCETSFAQERLWFTQQMEPDSSFYNVVFPVHLRGPLNVHGLAQSLGAVVRRHEALRTYFVSKEGRPFQAFDDASQVDLALCDIAGLEGDPAEVTDRIIESHGQLVFRLDQPPLFRFVLIRWSPQVHVLLFVIHHIIFDGWSGHIMLGEVRKLYQAGASGIPPALPPLPIQYKDHALAQRAALNEQDVERLIDYWRDKIGVGDAIPEIQLPSSLSQVGSNRGRGGRETFRIPQDVHRMAARFSRDRGVTLPITLMAAYKLLLSRYFQANDLIVSTAVANRTRVEIEPLIGFFMNMLPVRSTFSPRDSFAEVVSRVRASVLGALDHQKIPFERLVRALDPNRYEGVTRLSQVVFNFQKASTEWSVGELGMAPWEVRSNTSRFDISLGITEYPDGLRGVIDYNAELFSPEFVRQLADHFVNLLRAAIEAPRTCICHLPFLSDAEQDRILRRWGHTEKVAHTSSYVESFERRARIAPDSLSVVHGLEHLTYRELDRRANAVAGELQPHIVPEQPVPMFVDRSADLFVATIGILKAGAPFLPLNPADPADRVRASLEDVHSSVVITNTRLQSALPGTTGQRVLLADLLPSTREAPVSSAGPRNPAQLAYVVHTSGSSGGPKGVMIELRSFLNLHAALPGIQGRDRDLPGQRRVCLNGPFAFDASIKRLLDLLHGDCVDILPEEIKSDGDAIVAYLQERMIDEFVGTPTQVQLMLQAGLLDRASLSCPSFLVGGEAMSASMWRKLASQDRVRFLNVYGPTEATIDATFCRVSNDFERPHIGRPLAGVTAYVLDRFLYPVPQGVAGELCLSGECLARGYFRQPRLTAALFGPDPWAGEPGSRVYRTKDRARFLADGNIEYLYRGDQQIKLRGHRIELGEIAAALSAHPWVNQVAVVPRNVPQSTGFADPVGSQGSPSEIVAYVVPALDRLDPSRAAGLATEMEDRWREVHNAVAAQDFGGTASSPDDLNTIGWNSSYDGKPIPLDEMREWVDHKVWALQSLRPRRVLEIGCGTGMILARLAPSCSRYVATDFAPAALEQVRATLLSRRGLEHVTLLRQDADDFSAISAADFDLAILNSVVQYFPNVNYLIRVIEGLIKRMAPGGTIFIGDVRSLPLLDAFHGSVALRRSAPWVTKRSLRSELRQKLAAEEELVLAPLFFDRLRQILPEISRVAIRPTRGRCENELTKFRYDVELGVNSPPVAAADLVWRDGSRLAPGDVRAKLAEAPRYLAWRDVPNGRLTEELSFCRWLRSAGDEETVGQWRATQAHVAGSDVELEDLYQLGASLGFEVQVSWRHALGDGRFEIVFCRRDDDLGDLFAASGSEKSLREIPPAALANEPRFATVSATLNQELLQLAKRKLPDYMIPSSFVFLQSLPMNANGKLNVRELPEPSTARRDSAVKWIPPETATEKAIAKIWRQVLRIDDVGALDDFFALRGHSLLVTQVVAMIGQTFGVDVSVREFFSQPTIRALAARVDERSSDPTRELANVASL